MHARAAAGSLALPRGYNKVPSKYKQSNIQHVATPKMLLWWTDQTDHWMDPKAMASRPPSQDIKKYIHLGDVDRLLSRSVARMIQINS